MCGVLAAISKRQLGIDNVPAQNCKQIVLSSRLGLPKLSLCVNLLVFVQLGIDNVLAQMAKQIVLSSQLGGQNDPLGDPQIPNRNSGKWYQMLAKWHQLLKIAFLLF